MTWTRWKLLAGVLGLSVGGLAATCQEPNTRKCHNPPESTRQAVSLVPALPTLPAAAAVQTALTPPLPVVAPTPADAPTVAAVELKPVPPTPAAPPVAVAPLPTLDPPAPVPVDLPKPKAVELPKLDLAPPTVAVVPELPKPEPAKPDPLLAIAPVAPEPSKPDVAVPSVKVPAKPTADLPPAEVASLSGNVRVTLRLGDGRPNFDVLQGDDCLLKAVCDRVEVKSPGERADPMTPLKAAGGVRFSAPGCEGTCDALTVLPGTGEVELTGSVRVRCKQGKGETEVSGGTMRFKLGTAPGYSVSGPESGSIQASFRPTNGRK